MNSSTQKDSLSIRQRELQRKIFDALNNNDIDSFLLFQGQWVHRYGFEDFPDENKLQSLFGITESEEFDTSKSFEKKLLIELDNISNEEIDFEEKELSNQIIQNQLDIQENEIGEDLIGEQNPEIEESIELDNISNEEIDFEEKELNFKTQRNEEVKEKEIAHIPPPPPPSLNNLRRWLS